MRGTAEISQTTTDKQAAAKQTSDGREYNKKEESQRK
jgi:hypothetical protein